MTAASTRPRIVVLISGRGSNMQALVEASRHGDPAYEVAAVVSDQPEAGGLRIAAALGVPTRVVDRRDSADRADFESRLAAAIHADSPALVVLAGFMRVLSPGFVGQFADRIQNIHPSLLPSFPGLHTHRRALAAGALTHGATVHYVTAELDAGPPILQGRVAVMNGDDEASLAARVQQVEHRMFPLAVRWHCSGRLRCAAGAAWLDGRRLDAPVALDSVAAC